MAVKVILREDYPSLGYVGDLVTVKPGYARNFLLPRGIAVVASSSNGRLLKHHMEGIQAKRTKLKAQAQEFGNKLQNTPLEFLLKIGEAGKSFGAITAKDIEAAFKTKGIELNRKQIRLNEPIKTPGSYRIEVKVHSEISVHVPVQVNSEAQTKKAAEPKAAAKKATGRGKKAKEADTDDTAADTAAE